MNGSAAPSAVELLVFELDGVRHALELGTVREVARAVFITPLPESPPVVEGIIEVRGAVVPVYDLRLRFGLRPRPLHPDERIVLAWTGERLVAFRCDRADEATTVAAGAIDAATAVLSGGRRISGVARLNDGIVLIVDLRAFLDEAEQVTLQQALDALAERAAE